MPLRLFNFFNADGKLEKLRKDLIILSLITLVFKCNSLAVASSDDLSITFPLWFLPQTNIFSFLIGYFLTHGIKIALSILFWSLTYLLINYFIKLGSWKEELILSEFTRDRQKASENATLITSILNNQSQSAEILIRAQDLLENMGNYEKLTAKKEAPLLVKSKETNLLRARFSLLCPLLLFFYAWIISFPEGINLISACWPYQIFP